MIGEQQILETLRRVIGRSPAEKTEVVYMGGRSDLTRYTRSAIHQNVSEDNARVYVRVAEGRRLGVVTVNKLEEEELLKAAGQALDLARHQPENPYFGDFPQPARYQKTETYFQATAGFTPAARAETVKGIFAQAARMGFDVAGAFSTGEAEIAIANSNGVSAYQPLTEAEITTVPMSKEGKGLRSAFAAMEAPLILLKLTSASVKMRSGW